MRVFVAREPGSWPSKVVPQKLAAVRAPSLKVLLVGGVSRLTLVFRSAWGARLTEDATLVRWLPPYERDLRGTPFCCTTSSVPRHFAAGAGR